MARQRWTVAIDWEDRGVIDTDEVVVYAADEDSAKCKAKERWRSSIGVEWPQCRMLRVWILTPADRRPAIFRIVDFC